MARLTSRNRCPKMASTSKDSQAQAGWPDIFDGGVGRLKVNSEADESGGIRAN